MSIRHVTSKRRSDDVEQVHSDDVETSAAPAPSSVAGLLRDAPTGAALASQLGAQPRLKVGGADDTAEREADAMARDAVEALRSLPVPTAELPAGSTSGGLVARLADGTIGREGGDLDETASAALDDARKGGGSPLPGGVRQSMESAMGADFSGVRVHTGSDASALSGHMGAQAFTVGRDVFFGSGMPNVQTAEGQHLLAHELTHTIQQGAAPQSIAREVGAKKSPSPAISAPFNATSTNTQATVPIQRPDEALSGRARSGAKQQASEQEATDKIEAKAFVASTAAQAYTKNLFNPVWDGLLGTLGLTRGAFRRSKEQNDMRQLLKDAARAQANKEIADKVDSGSVAEAGGERGKKNFKNKAFNIAYKTAKISVDNVVRQKAFDIADRRTVGFKPDLVKAGEDAATGPLNKTTKGLITKAIIAEAEAKQDEVFDDAVAEASTFVTELATAKKSPPSGGGDPQAVEDVRSQVTEDKVADKVIEKTIEAQTMGAAFKTIQALIDREIPEEDDECELEISVSLPCGHGFSVDFGYDGSAAREDDGVTLENQITLGVSWSAVFGEIKGAMGLVLNAKGADTAAAMQLINFGMYQGVNNVSAAAGGYFWGNGGRAGVSNEAEARLWANDMAERYLKGENTYVDIGWLVMLGAKIDAGVGDVEAELVYQNLKRFREKAKETTPPGGGPGGGPDDLWETAKRHELSGKANLSLGAPQGLAFELTGKSTWEERALESLEFGASVEVSTSLLSTITGGASDIGAKIYEKMNYLYGKMNDKEKEAEAGKPGAKAEKPESTGQKIAAAEEDVDQLGVIPKAVEESIQEKTTEMASAAGIDISGGEEAYSVEIGIEIEFKNGKADKWTVSVDLKKSSKAGFTAKIGNAGAEVAKTKTSKIWGASKAFGPGAQKPATTPPTTPSPTP